MSASERRFECGDKIRDHAQLGGEVIATWGDAVKVRWNSGTEAWVARIRLRLAETATKDAAS